MVVPPKEVIQSSLKSLSEFGEVSLSRISFYLFVAKSSELCPSSTPEVSHGWSSK